MPESKRRKKKGYQGRPTPPRPRTNIGALLSTMKQLDEAEEELLIQEIDKMNNEQEENNAP